MALTVAEILSGANKIAGRQETDLTEYIRNVIHDLENDSIFLDAAEEMNLVAGQRAYNLSDLDNEYRLPLKMQPKDTGGLYHEILSEISYDEYKDRLRTNSGNSRPLVFAIFGDKIYLDPAPLAFYSKMDIWGRKMHGDVVTTILYPEKYRELLVNGCAFQIGKRYGLTDKQSIVDALTMYEKQKMSFIVRKANSKGHNVRYRDL